MANFTVELFDRLHSAVRVPPQLAAKPVRWSAHARGGPDAAEIELRGPQEVLWQTLQWLRYGVQIRNEFGVLVWWGYVHEALVTVGGAAMGLSLEGMRNSIKVLYTHEDADGAAMDDTTSAANDADSQNEYGVYELRHSAGDLTQTGAEKLRDTLLGWHKSPVPMAESGTGTEPMAVLRCRGWYETLSWRYYSDDAGRLVVDAGSGEQTLGWRLTSTLIGFTGNKRIHAQTRSIAALRAGEKVVVTGSGSNNGTFTVAEDAGDPADDAPLSLTSTTVYFEANDDIWDTEGKLGFLTVDEMLEVSGSALNSGWYWVDESGARHVTMIDDWGSGPIVDELAGTSVTLKGSISVRVDEALVNEAPGASISLTPIGQKCAQSFTPPTGTGTWEASEINLRVYKRLGPADNLRVELCADSAGSPGTVLATKDLAASELLESVFGWRTWTFASPVNVTAGTTYWIVVSRTSSLSNAAYYRVAVDEDEGYGDGAMKVYDGSAWVARNPPADMAFQVWGLRENTTQIADMVSDCGQFLAGIDVQATSGIKTRHYREGEGTALDEIDALLDQGTSGAGRLMAWVDAARWLSVFAEPASNLATDLQIGGDGRLYQAQGQPLAIGAVPAGKWARVRGLPQTAALAPLSPLYLERVEYDAVADQWYWEPRGAPSLETMPTSIQRG